MYDTDFHARQPKKRGGPLQEFHDGTKVLPGFVLQTEPLVGPPLLACRVFRSWPHAYIVFYRSQLPPQPPPGWQPNPSRLWKENQPPPTDVKGKGKQLDADEVRSVCMC